jgi:hypothetical protein
MRSGTLSDASNEQVWDVSSLDTAMTSGVRDKGHVSLSNKP